MFLQLPLVGLLSRVRSGSSSQADFRILISSGAIGLGCRIIRITLAIYLLPAVLIVFLVGAIGMLVYGAIRLLARLFDATSD